MTQNKSSEAVMIGALKQLEAGRKAEDVGREVGVSKHTIYAWRAKYGGMAVSEAQEAKQLREENTRLKKLVVDPVWHLDVPPRHAKSARAGGPGVGSSHPGAVDLCGADTPVRCF
jgi:putative transposase